MGLTTGHKVWAEVIDALLDLHPSLSSPVFWSDAKIQQRNLRSRKHWSHKKEEDRISKLLFGSELPGKDGRSGIPPLDFCMNEKLSLHQNSL